MTPAPQPDAQSKAPPSPAAEPVPPAAPAPSSPTQLEQAAAKPPSFDIVRVEPTGDSVVAARVAPNAEVVLLDNGTPIARGKADANGQIALIPPSLKPGEHSLVLSMTPPGGKETVSAQSVVVSVPVEPRTAPLVALIQPNQPAAVLSGPVAGGVSSSPPPPRPAAPGPGRVTRGVAAAAPPARVAVIVRSVEVESMGSFYASGKAAPGSTSRVYLNGAFVAAVPADLNGTWSLKINHGMKPGHYAVRVDQIDASGKVVARAEVPFDYPSQVAGNGTRTDLAKKNIASIESGGDAGAESGADGSKTADPATTGSQAAAISPNPGAGGAEAHGAGRSVPQAQSTGPTGSSTASSASGQAAATPVPTVATDSSKPSAGDAGSQVTAKSSVNAEPAGSTPAPPPAPVQPETVTARNTAIASATESGDAKPSAGAPLTSAPGIGKGSGAPPSSVPGSTSQAAGEPGASSGGSQPMAPAESASARATQAGSTDDDAAPAIVVEELITAKVEQGNSLWRISRRMLGQGLRYTQIYAANTQQIRDPRLIYPGQVFVMPQD